MKRKADPTWEEFFAHEKAKAQTRKRTSILAVVAVNLLLWAGVFASLGVCSIAFRWMLEQF